MRAYAAVCLCEVCLLWLLTIAVVEVSLINILYVRILVLIFAVYSVAIVRFSSAHRREDTTGVKQNHQTSISSQLQVCW